MSDRAVTVNVTVEGIPGLDTVVRKARRWDSDAEEYAYADVTLADEIVLQVAGSLMEGRQQEVLRERIAAVTNEEIRAKVRELLTAALEKGFQPTNGYGQPQGPRTTLEELLVAEFHKAMAGKRDSYNNNPGILEKLLREEVGLVFTKELKPVIDQAKKDAKAAVEAHAAKFLADAALSLSTVK
jgi:hypothetical protein